MDKISEQIYQMMRESYEAKIRELPPPPPGFFYGISDYSIRKDGGNYIIDAELTLQPIIK